MADQPAEQQVCPICGVTIIPRLGGDRVVFSSGPEGTRAKLWARVCQFAKKPECINNDRDSIGSITPNDYFKPDVSGGPSA